MSEENTQRRLTRRQFLGSAAVTAAGAILAACGGGATTATQPAAPKAAAPTTAPAAAPTTAPVAKAAAPTTAPAAAPTTAAAAPKAAPKLSGSLQVWGGVPPENGPQDLVDAFMKVYPDVKVTYTRYVNDDTGNTKLDTALQGGTPIDVYFSYSVPRMSQRIKAGAGEDLTPFINADEQIKKWVDGTSGIFKMDNKYQSLPTTLEPNFVFINKKMLDAAGVTIPANWTIDDFVATAKKLSTGSGNNKVYGVYAPPDLALMTLGANYWYKPDGKSSNFDNPAFKQSLELQRKMIQEGSAFPWTEVLAQNLRAYQQNPFLSSQMAMWISSSFSLRYVNDLTQYPHDFITTFAPVPKPTGASSYFTPGGINNWLMMHPKTTNKDASWALIKYWLTDGAKFMLKGGKIPAFPGTSQDEVVAGILGPDRAKLYDVEAYKKVIFDPNIKLVTDSITTAAADIQKVNQQEMDRYLIGEITFDQWLQSVKSQADAAIAKAG